MDSNERSIDTGDWYGAMSEAQLRTFDRKLDGILRTAAEVFCACGYHRASIRDISRSTGVSLAGLYYYFQSKEQLLYLIQRHAFQTLLAQARVALAEPDDPEERLRTFVELHLRFFLEHPNEMKVLTHEEESLKDELRRELKAIKKAYYRLCFDQVDTLKHTRRLSSLDTRLAVLSLFGMMNWIYTWYNPRVDPDAATMAAHMSDTFLYGILGAGARRTGEAGAVMARTRGANGAQAPRLRPAGANGSGRTIRANGSTRPGRAR
ncbi:MAG TPA: TetR/AcrR family transcriptional regulator [Terriglobia bacterium]|nr:TetR/AcrR family transcriptional regulator [Terriglobia bacterium]